MFLILAVITACNTLPETALVPAGREEPKTDLWLLAIGINEYSNNYFPNLFFAASDAQNINSAFKAQEGKAFKKVNTLLITDIDAIKPTKTNIFSNLEFLQDAQPEDTIIIFLASHRIMENNIYYLMPSDSVYREDTGLDFSSMIKFEDFIQELNMPGNKIIILDTQFPEGASKMAAEKGIIILGACGESQQAIEHRLLGGGLLSLSVVEALNTNTGVSGSIRLKDIFAFVAARVKELSENKQDPVLHVPADAENMVLGVRN